MQVKRLKQYFAAFTTYLATEEARYATYLYDVQARFQTHWDIEQLDFARMYEEAVQSPVSRRLWKREQYFPKEMMVRFLTADPHFGRQAFKDLFQESKDVSSRVDRFVFFCDQMLADYREAHPLEPYNRHFHDDDYWMCFLYLSLRYPEQYCPHDADAFRVFLTKVGAVNPPLATDTQRFVKLMRTLEVLLVKETALQQAHQARFATSPIKSRMLCYEVYDFVAKNA